MSSRPRHRTRRATLTASKSRIPWAAVWRRGRRRAGPSRNLTQASTELDPSSGRPRARREGLAGNAVSGSGQIGSAITNVEAVADRFDLPDQHDGVFVAEGRPRDVLAPAATGSAMSSRSESTGPRRRHRLSRVCRHLRRALGQVISNVYSAVWTSPAVWKSK